ncbi:MAG: TonB-dependent receptor [Treponema sp.]|nr:TonB-dependent receptor [Treponema sp.]
MIYLLLFLLLPFSLFAQDLDDEYFFAESGGITIVGTVQTSQQMGVVEKEQIERSSAGDLANLLQETLGLNIVRYGAYGNQAGINLRGFDSKRVAFLIDGIPANSSIDGKFDINLIDLNLIERIEVIYGGSDSKYNVSGAFGGIINIITVRRQEKGFKISASVSNTSVMPASYRNRSGEMQNPHWEDLFDTQNFSLSAVYGGRNFSFTAGIFANRAENHFVFIDYANNQRRKDNNEIWDTGASVTFVWELNELTKLISSSKIYYSDRNIPVSGFSANFGSQKDFSVSENLMLDVPRAFHDKLATEASFGFLFHRLNYASPSGLASVHDQLKLTVVNRWSWFAGSTVTFRYGIDYRFTSLDSTEIGIRERHDGGIYLTAEIMPLKQLQIIPSAKAVFSSGAGGYAVIPKLGFLWKATGNFAIKNNFFRSFKFPDFEELYWNSGGINTGGGFGNPDLAPEDGWGADLGVEWRITENLQMENTLFAQWLLNSIHWFSNSGVWRPENAGEAVFFGIDSKVNLTIPVSTGFINKITVSLSYQYLLSYLLCYGYTFASNKRIPYNPEHTINGSLEIFWKTGSLSISARYESLRYHDTANITALKPLFLLNAGVNQNIGKNITIFGSLRNILNTSYESFYDYPMPGITLSLGMRLELK